MRLHTQVKVHASVCISQPSTQRSVHCLRYMACWQHLHQYNIPELACESVQGSGRLTASTSIRHPWIGWRVCAGQWPGWQRWTRLHGEEWGPKSQQAAEQLSWLCSSWPEKEKFHVPSLLDIGSGSEHQPTFEAKRCPRKPYALTYVGKIQSIQGINPVSSLKYRCWKQSSYLLHPGPAAPLTRIQDMQQSALNPAKYHIQVTTVWVLCGCSVDLASEL